MTDSSPVPPPTIADPNVVLYCANHPTVETSLRCNRCNKPICPKCAIAVPTGYRCLECVRGQQKIFETAEWYDYPVAFVIAMLLGGLGAYLTSMIGFFTILLAPAAGMVISEAVRIAVRKRRSLRLWQVVAAGVIVGCLPILLLSLLSGNLMALLFQAIYAATAVTTTIARIRGINVR